ncbi:MAG TPA: hypothetical protein DIV41_02345 [Ruminococcaceae bacterium]|nr:hypothetical protein [Oscillospiraceae bacterium]
MKKNIIPAAIASFSVLMSAAGTAPAFAAANARCDTTLPFSIQPGASYTFKVSVSGTSAAPSFTAGNSGILKISPAGKNGGDYFFKAVATGTAGSGTGVYTSLPGQKPVRQCVVNIGSPSNGVSTTTVGGNAVVTTPANVTWLYSMMPSQEVTACKENNYSIYNGADGHGNDCKQAVKYQFDLDPYDYDDSSADKDPDFATYAVSYPVNSQYKSFSTILTGSLYDSTTHLTVIGDGRTLYETGFSSASGLINLNIDISSVNTLTFQFSSEYSSCSVEQIILSGAQLIK